MSEPLADLLCRLASRAAYRLMRRARRNVLANLGHVLPQASETERRRVARRVFYHVARNYYELLCLPWLTADRLRREFRFEGPERLRPALAEGRGVIAVSPHLGSFNIVPQFGVTEGLAMTIIMEQLEPPALYEFLAHLRAGQNVQIVPAGRASLRPALAALRRGQTLVLAGDRDVTGTGVKVPFFGQLARLPGGPAALALRTRAALLPMYTYREARNRSVIVTLDPIPLVRTDDHDADIAATTARVAAALETAISRAPEQWVVLQSVWGD